MDLYKILSVDKNSSQEEIKKAYRKASMKHHPDRGGNAEEFKKINNNNFFLIVLKYQNYQPFLILIQY